MWPFSSGNSVEQSSDVNERNAQLNEVLISGRDISTLLANCELSAGEAVKAGEKYVAKPCESLSELYGIVLFDVSEGGEVSVVSPPAEVRVPVRNGSANDSVKLSDSTTWEKAESGNAAVLLERDDGMGVVRLRGVFPE